MNIVCEKCATVYRIDPKKIPPGGKKVKCSKCQHIFLATPPEIEDETRAADTDEDLAVELQEDAEKMEERATRRSVGGEKKNRLLLRQDGTRYAMNDLATLQRWIVERRISRDAELSEDGEVWEKVGERMDLLPFFGIVERSSRKKAARRQHGHDSKAGSSAGRSDDIEESTEPPESAMTLNPADIAGSQSKLELERALEATGRSHVKLTRSSDKEQPVAEKETSTTAEASPASEAASATKAAAPHDERAGGGNRAFVFLAIIAILVAGGYFVKIRYIDVRHPSSGQSGPVRESGNRVVGSQAKPVQVAGGARSGVAPHAAVPSPIPSPPPARAVAVPSPSPSGLEPADTAAKTAGGASPVAPGHETGEKSGEGNASASSPAPEQPRKQPVTVSKASSPASTKPASTATTATSQSVKHVSSSSRGTGASANRLLAAGRSYLRNRQYDKAVKAFRAATEKSPNSALAQKELGLGLMNLADVNYASRDEYYQEAVVHFRQAIKLDSSFAEAYHLLGVVYMQIDKKEEAVENLRKALDNGLSGDDATEASVFLQNLQDELAQ